MRLLGIWTLGLAFLYEPSAAASDPDARAAVERAVQAQGGAAALSRAAVASRKVKGVLFLKQEAAFQGTETFQLPDRLRLSVELSRTPFVQVLDGSRGWEQSGGTTAEMTPLRLAEVQEEAYVWWLATLAPLLKDGVDLSLLPPEKVKDRPAVGVLARTRGRPESALYFDKESGRLVKIVRRAHEGGSEVRKEYFYDDYRDVDGARLPTRETVLRDGQKFSEVTYSDYCLLREPDAKAFTRP
jgi:hypothetical protein